MEALVTISRHYRQIEEKLQQLYSILQEADDENGLSEEQMQTFGGFTDFVNRDIKNQLRVEEEVLTSLRKELGEKNSEYIRQAINEHDVLYGALDQFVYGIATQSEPDIMESAKSMLDHFPPHIERIDSIAANSAQMLQ